MRHITLIVAVVALAFAAPAFSGKGGNGNGGGSGNGNGSVTTASGSCTASGTTVTATGLPTDQVINFMVTDLSGTHGWVLGFTSSGAWWVPVDAPTGPTTYEFVSRTFGPSGSKYSVFASCST